MNTNVNITRTLITLATTALAALTLIGSAAAQDSFEVKIKRVTNGSMEANYAAMTQQANKACARESNRVMDRGIPRKERRLYTEKCSAQVMDALIDQTREAKLSAYHKGMKASAMPVKLSAK